MAVSIPKSQADALGFDLAGAVIAFEAARLAHASTEDEPAPTAHPLVEEIVRLGGDFDIVDDTPIVTPAAMRGMLALAVQDELVRRVDAIISPARRQLAQLDFARISNKPTLPEGQPAMPDVTYRTTGEAVRYAELQTLFEGIGDIQRHALLLQIEIEDLSDDEVDGWQSHSWP